MQGSRAQGRGRGAERGALLIEILLGLLVLALAAAGSVSSTLSGMSLEEENRDTAAATNTLRHMLEELETMPLEEVFARFNADPTDDPDGVGTAIGSTFALDAFRTSGLLTTELLTYANPPPPMTYPIDMDVPPEPLPAPKATALRPLMNVEITFPVDMDGNLAENVTGGIWGTQGWDMDGDGTIASGDRSEGYKLIPIHLRLTWTNARGAQSITAVRVLASRD